MHRFCLLVLALLLPGPILAAEPHPDLLARVDAYRMPRKDVRVMVDVLEVDVLSGQRSGEHGYRVFLNNASESVVEMLSPAERGRRVLMTDDAVWLHIPTSARPLRITPLQRLLGQANAGDVGRLHWDGSYRIVAVEDAAALGRPQMEAAAEDGDAALEALRTTPVDIAFLDIRMPGCDGLQVAAAMERPCLVVFVTAYEQFAVDAFERAALDYLLKPVAPERLRQTVARLKERLSAPAAPDFASTMQTLSTWGQAEGGGPMKWVRAQQGPLLRLIPVEDICYFQARDKYTSVWTPTHEFLIRTPLKDLEANLDPDVFWRVHRSYLVNAKYIAAIKASGLSTLKAEIRRPGGVSVPISRAQARRFRSM